MITTTDAQPVASSTAPATPTTPATLPASSVRERINSLSGEERTRYQQTGELPEDTTPQADPSPATTETQAAGSSPDATKGPEGATGEDEQEPETVHESEKAKKSRERNAKRWDEVIEERGRLKAENEILRKQLAEGTAPKTSTVEERKAVAEGDPRPDPEDYQTLKEWQKDDTAWIDRRLDARLNKEKSLTEAAKSKAAFTAAIEEAAATRKDFSEVILRTKPTPAEVGVIQANPKLVEALYWLGQPENAEERQRILALTDIDGRSAKDLNDAAKTDHGLQVRIARVMAIAESELGAIARALKTKASPKETTTVSGKFPPSSTVQVPAKGTAVGDPIEEALARKDTRSYIRLMREKDARELKSR